MLFWLILHSLQLSGAEAAEPEFSGKKWIPSCLIRSSPNAMKFYGEHFYEDWLGITGGGGEGTHQAARRVPGAAPLLAAPGTLLGAWWPPSVPPFVYISPLGWKPLNKSRFHVSSPPRGGNLQRRKAISGGQIPPGRSPPGRGDRRHHHHHRHGHHRYHHQHHPQHQHHLHLHPISSHNCNLCCNPYYLSSLLYWC